MEAEKISFTHEDEEIEVWFNVSPSFGGNWDQLPDDIDYKITEIYVDGVEKEVSDEILQIIDSEIRTL